METDLIKELSGNIEYQLDTDVLYREGKEVNFKVNKGIREFKEKQEQEKDDFLKEVNNVVNDTIKKANVVREKLKAELKPVENELVSVNKIHKEVTGIFTTILPHINPTKIEIPKEKIVGNYTYLSHSKGGIVVGRTITIKYPYGDRGLPMSPSELYDFIKQNDITPYIQGKVKSIEKDKKEIYAKFNAILNKYDLSETFTRRYGGCENSVSVRHKITPTEIILWNNNDYGDSFIEEKYEVTHIEVNNNEVILCGGGTIFSFGLNEIPECRDLKSISQIVAISKLLKGIKVARDSLGEKVKKTNNDKNELINELRNEFSYKLTIKSIGEVE